MCFLCRLYSVFTSTNEEVTTALKHFFTYVPSLLILLFTQQSPQALTCFYLSHNQQQQQQSRVGSRGNEMAMTTTFFLLFQGISLTLEKPEVQTPASNRPQRRHFIPQPSLYQVEQSVFVWFASTCTKLWPSEAQISIRLLCLAKPKCSYYIFSHNL